MESTVVVAVLSLVVERVAIAENTLKSQQHQIDELKGDM